MQGFQTNPKLEFLYVMNSSLLALPIKLFDGDRAILIEDLTYTDKRGRRHKAKAGMVTDGGSVPKRFWRKVSSPYRDLLPAYIIHDWYCQRARDIKDGKGRRNLRKCADKLLAEMVTWIRKELPLVRVKRTSKNLIYAGVRLGAWTEELRRLLGMPIDNTPH